MEARVPALLHHVGELVLDEPKNALALRQVVRPDLVVPRFEALGRARCREGPGPPVRVRVEERPLFEPALFRVVALSVRHALVGQGFDVSEALPRLDLELSPTMQDDGALLFNLVVVAINGVSREGMAWGTMGRLAGMLGRLAGMLDRLAGMLGRPTGRLLGRLGRLGRLIGG